MSFSPSWKYTAGGNRAQRERNLTPFVTRMKPISHELSTRSPLPPSPQMLHRHVVFSLLWMAKWTSMKFQFISWEGEGEGEEEDSKQAVDELVLCPSTSMCMYFDTRLILGTHTRFCLLKLRISVRGGHAGSGNACGRVVVCSYGKLHFCSNPFLSIINVSLKDLTNILAPKVVLPI